MAFDKQHISELKKEITLVKKLGDKVGYLVLLSMASAIFKVKDTEGTFKNKKYNVLKNYLTEIVNDVENEDEDYYKLVQETLKQNSTFREDEYKTEIPTLDYWMLNIISDALQKEYNKRSKDKNLNAVLAQIAKEDGLDKAKAVKAEVDSNRWDNVGQVACCMQRIEEIKEAITLAVKKG